MSRRSQPSVAPGPLEKLIQPRLSYLLDDIQEFSAILDRSGTILYRSRTPSSPAVSVGSKIYDAVRPHCRDAMRAAVRRALQTGEVQSCEVVSSSSGSSYRARLVPIVENRQAIVVGVVAGDISEGKRVEEGLRDTPQAGESQHRGLLDAIPDLIFRFDGEGRLLDFSPAKGQEPAIPPAEFIGRTISEVLPADLASEAMHHIERALQTGETQVFAYTLPVPLPDGNPRDYEARIAVSGKNEVVAIARDITQRKRAERKLREGEERLRTLVADAPVIMFAINAEGVFSVAEGKAMSLVGLKQDEHIGRSAFDMYHDVPGVIDAARRALAGETFTTIVETGDRVFEAHVSPVRDANGAITGAIAVATDITDRARAEGALRESEERYRSLSEATVEGIVMIDDSGRVLDASQQAAAIVGCELPEIIGKDPLSFVVPDSRDLVRQHITSAREEFYEAVGLRKDGTTFPMEVRGRVAFYQGREVRVSVVRDLTERKRAEEALRESENRFRTLSEASFEGIAIHDKGTIVDGNQAFASMFGYELSEAIGMHVLDFVAPESRDPVSDNIVSKYQEPFEFTGLRKDGATFPVEVCGRAIPYQGKMVTVAALRDLAERKRMEEALQRAREELEERVERRMQRGNVYDLTFRELTVLHLAAAGRADKEIAFQLAISPRTANKHVENILQKMGAASRTEASVRALREGLVGRAD
jgi:PAS domain S-box-containing protein